jgi:hypothetical protein
MRDYGAPSHSPVYRLGSLLQNPNKSEVLRGRFFKAALGQTALVHFVSQW